MTPLHFPRVSSSITWSVCAGLYTFVAGTAIAFVLSDILSLLAAGIGLPAEYSMVILASPTLVVGPVGWWAIVERRGSYTYFLGGAFGFVTALSTGLLWAGQFVRVWGAEMVQVPIIAFLVIFVLGVVGIAGALTGLPLMYARRRREDESLEGKAHPR